MAGGPQGACACCGAGGGSDNSSWASKHSQDHLHSQFHLHRMNRKRTAALMAEGDCNNNNISQKRAAWHQVCASSAVCAVERKRLSTALLLLGCPQA